MVVEIAANIRYVTRAPVAGASSVLPMVADDGVSTLAVTKALEVARPIASLTVEVVGATQRNVQRVHREEQTYALPMVEAGAVR